MADGDDDNPRRAEFQRAAAAWWFSAVQQYANDKQLKHDRNFTGIEAIIETLTGHPKVCPDLYRLSLANFRLLCHELRDRWFECKGDVIIEEKVGMFLSLVGHGTVMRVIAYDFQHSEETVWRSIREVLHHVLLMLPDYIKLPSADAPIHPSLREGSKFHPFEDALGAIDGTHIETFPDSDETCKERWHNRKGFMSQNVMAVVDFDGNFLAIDAGWEGFAHDATILRRAVEDGFMVPEGRYYLVDQGYANSHRFLSPYRTGIYHLASFQAWSAQDRIQCPED